MVIYLNNFEMANLEVSDLIQASGHITSYFCKDK